MCGGGRLGCLVCWWDGERWALVVLAVLLSTTSYRDGTPPRGAFLGEGHPAGWLQLVLLGSGHPAVPVFGVFVLTLLVTHLYRLTLY